MARSRRRSSAISRSTRCGRSRWRSLGRERRRRRPRPSRPVASDGIHHGRSGSVSLHVLFGLALTLIAVGRLAWRLRAGDRILRGGQRIAFTLVTLLGLWLLFGGGQVGGGISHR